METLKSNCATSVDLLNANKLLNLLLELYCIQIMNLSLFGGKLFFKLARFTYLSLVKIKDIFLIFFLLNNKVLYHNSLIDAFKSVYESVS